MDFPKNSRSVPLDLQVWQPLYLLHPLLPSPFLPGHNAPIFYLHSYTHQADTPLYGHTPVFNFFDLCTTIATARRKASVSATGPAHRTPAYALSMKNKIYWLFRCLRATMADVQLSMVAHLYFKSYFIAVFFTLFKPFATAGIEIRMTVITASANR